MNPQKATIVFLAMLFVSFALAEDFKTVSGKIYKDATISRVEADGIVLRTKTGISKVYFAELPKDVQERFHYGSATPTGKAVTQRIDKAESANHAADPLVPIVPISLRNKSRKSSTSGNRSYRGNTRPAPAELMMIREFNFHKAFLAGIAIIACALFAIVWARFK